MDKTLKTLHLRLSGSSKSLTKNAISQIIIKILFASQNPIHKQEIASSLKKYLKVDISSDRIDESIQKLLDDNEIKFYKKKYSLTRTNVKQLEDKIKKSNERLNRIIDRHFSPFHSEKEAVINWFSDATIEFFKNYSSEWVSDIRNKRSEKIKKKKENIFEHIERRTRNNKELEKEDYDDLTNKYINCVVNVKDPDLDELLWEYGTSSFAANLIQSSLGADPISLSAFSNSKCVIDTNVLINIVLEASEFSKAIQKIDSIFTKLNIIPGYFEITREEYINTIGHKVDEILRTVQKFSFEVIEQTDDEFLQSAIIRQCHLPEHFSAFCKQIINPPNYVGDNLEIIKFNDSKELITAIENGISDDRKKQDLNTIFYNIANRDKSFKTLEHDVGLISGVEHLRKNEKAFILSQELSINEYSHTKPLKDNLPIALRLETLINILAIDNGGVEVDPTDYSDLFASIIRNNLQPERETFKISDLSTILDTELQIEQLPPIEVIKIANKLHKNKCKGLSDDDIYLELNRDFQETKLQFVDEYADAKEKLAFETKEKLALKEQELKNRKALRNRIKEQELKNYDKAVLRSRLLFYLLIPILIIGITVIGIYISNKNNSIDNYTNYVIGISINIIFLVIGSFIFTKPKLMRLNERKKNDIERKVDEILEKEIK